MARIKWAVILPLVQFSLALSLYYYEPHEYLKAVAAREQQTHSQNVQSSLTFWEQHWPHTAGVLLRGINYPALVVSTGFDFRSRAPLYSNELRELYLKAVAFFLFILLLWYFIGLLIDKKDWRSTERARSKRHMQVFAYAVGVIVGVLGIYVAISRLVHGSMLVHERDVFICGITWSILLLTYFIPRLGSVLMPSDAPEE